MCFQSLKSYMNELIRACEEGNLDYIKQFYSLTSDNLLATCCINGHIEAAKLLHSLIVEENNTFSKRMDSLGFSEAGIIRERSYNLQKNIALSKSCLYGYFEIAKWLIDIGADVNESHALYNSCSKGYFEIVRWLVEYGADYGYNEFDTSCENNHLEIAQYIYSPEENDYDLGEIFISCCEYGNFEVVKWLHSIGTNINYRFSRGFWTACGGGHYDIAKWMYDTGTNIHSYNDRAFRYSCLWGHYEIAKWLHELGASSLDKSALEYCCSKGHLKLANWLISIGKNNILHTDVDNLCCKGMCELVKWIDKMNLLEIDYSRCIRFSCSAGYFKLSKWLVTKGAAVNYNLFESSCEGGYFEQSKWLHSLGADINSDNEGVFVKSCVGGFLKQSKWLHSLGAKINESVFLESCLRGHLKIAKWLYSIGTFCQVRQNNYINSFGVIKWLHSVGIYSAKNIIDYCVDNHKVLKWVHQLDNSVFYKNLEKITKNYNRVTMLEVFNILEIPDEHIRLVMCVVNNIPFPEIDDIDDNCIIFLASHNKKWYLNNLKLKFSFFDFEIDQDNHIDLVINRRNIKSARKVEYYI